MEIEEAVNKLSNSLRIYNEVAMQTEKLKHIDKEEAINNFDRSFESLLESFHSLYDVTKNKFEYFENADSALIILLRNAIHHKNHPLFNSWNKEMNLLGGLERNNGSSFLLAGQVVNNNEYVIRQYYKLEDFFNRISLDSNYPYLDNKISINRKINLKNKFLEELNFQKIKEEAILKKILNKENVYINVVPILISAISKVFKKLKEDNIEVKGFDSDVYMDYFTNDVTVDLNNFNYEECKIIL